jgi:hypothetical protein
MKKVEEVKSAKGGKKASRLDGQSASTHTQSIGRRKYGAQQLSVLRHEQQRTTAKVGGYERLMIHRRLKNTQDYC